MIRSWNNWVFSAWIILGHNSYLQMFEGLTCQRLRWLKLQRVELRTSKLKLTGNSGHSNEDIYNNQSCKQNKYCALLGDKHQTFSQGLSGHNSVMLERIPAQGQGWSRRLLWAPLAFPGGSVVKNPPSSVGDTGSIPDPGRSHLPQSNKPCAPQLLSLCSRVWEPQLLSPHTTAEASVP